MRLSVVAFTAAGADLAVRAARALEKNGHTLLDIRVIKSGVSKELCSLSEWTRTAFDSDGIIFVGACGIAVRAIAPYIRDKMTDPAGLQSRCSPGMSAGRTNWRRRSQRLSAVRR